MTKRNAILIQAKRTLINQAKSQYGTILPCNSKKSVNECFLYFKGRMYLFFNVKTDDSTRATSVDLTQLYAK